MVLLASTALHPSHSLPVEQRMAPELAKIYHSNSSDSRNGQRKPRQSPPSTTNGYERGSTNMANDPTLTSLAQLGVYRLGCTRAFVTILDNREAHVIAEAATSNNAARKTSTETWSLLGTNSLYLELESTISAPTSNIVTTEGAFVARDLGLEERLTTHPFVTRYPHARFYAEVPLRGSSGEILGTYGVVDSSPRASGPAELTNLHDIGGTISRYLENVWTTQHNRRSERRLNALLNFIKGGPESLGAEQKLRKKCRTSSHISSRSSAVSSMGRLSMSSSGNADGPSFFDSHGFDGGPLSPRDTHQQHVRKCSEDTNNLVLVSSAASTPGQTSWIFSHASSLLQEAMDLDGVLFLDASRNNSRSSSCGSGSDWETASKDTTSDDSRNSGDLSSHGTWSEKLCEPLGVAASGRLQINGIESSHVLTEGLLHDLFTAFPHGEVFHFQPNHFNQNKADGFTKSRHLENDRHAHHTFSNRLAQSFPDAKSVLFFPLWNWDKSRWLAATIAWTRQEQRRLGEDDLHYVRAFGDLIVSEFSQIDWSATERSKSDLLSSVSHELRSPLHGMLASTELLQSTSLEPTQRDMVSMVETCGLTLLDTMNYLLDFAKINNLTRVHKRSGPHDAYFDDLTSEFGLDTLVEDVTDALYSGHRTAINASKLAGRYLPVGAGVGSRDETKQLNNLSDLSVVVRIEEQDSWKIQSISGGWRRIIMNLLGNAFKFTQEGFIEVSLAKKVERGSGPNVVLGHLTITDTGCGISPDFLKHKLYTPFAQESILTEGVGLGLSIVQQLVTYLGGYIEIKSEVDVGTQVDVYVPVEFVETEAASQPFDMTNFPRSRVATRVCLVGLNAYVNLKQTPQGLLTTEAKRKLSIRSAVSNILLSQPGWMVSCGDSIYEAVGDIVVLEESTLKKIAEEGPIKPPFRSIIVLGEHGVSIPGDFAIEGAEVIYIPQPLGPRKLIQALQRFTESQPQIDLEGESPIFGPIPGVPMRGRSLSEAFAMAKGTESPPVVKENVSDYSPSSPKGSSRRELNVLIVDDNDINLKILSTFLRKIGCDFETASNGLVALEKYKSSSRKFDYVLMDISMPIMDGIVASGRIREYEEHHSLPRTTIMAVTGVASSEMQQQAFAAGIDDYLVKPLSLHDLKRIMSIT